MIDCPTCHSSCTEVLESRTCNNGTRRRRHLCLDCGNRWTTWDGPRPKQGAAAGCCHAKRPDLPPRLTEGQVRLILERRDLSGKALARQLGRSAEAIRQVRRGTAYREVLPDLPRWRRGQPKGPSCYACSHWSAGCLMGFPDPMVEGPGFARDCSLYATGGCEGL